MKRYVSTYYYYQCYIIAHGLSCIGYILLTMYIAISLSFFLCFFLLLRYVFWWVDKVLTYFLSHHHRRRVCDVVNNSNNSNNNSNLWQWTHHLSPMAHPHGIVHHHRIHQDIRAIVGINQIPKNDVKLFHRMCRCCHYRNLSHDNKIFTYRNRILWFLEYYWLPIVMCMNRFFHCFDITLSHDMGVTCWMDPWNIAGTI